MNEYQARRSPGMGIASRFTIGLGLVATVVAIVAAFILLNGIDEIGNNMGTEAQVEMASETARLNSQQAIRRDTLTMVPHRSQSNAVVQVGQGKVLVEGEPHETMIFLASPGNAGGPKSISQEFYAPLDSTASASQKIMSLIILVFAAFVFIVLLMASFTAHRITTPLNEMVEDVLAISRGRLDTSIGAEDAVGEVAHLATAVERMVDDLLASQQQAQDLADSLSETANLRDVQRRLQPMVIPVIDNWQVSSCVLEADGPGTGDFVDAMHEEENGLTTAWVGVPSIGGLAGALIMTMTRSYLRVRLLSGMALAESLDKVNNALHRDLARGMYCTVMATRFNPRTGEAEIVSAGHQSPAIRFDAASGEMRTLQPNGIALGFDAGPIFRNSIEVLQAKLNPRDALFMCSPGLSSCITQNGEPLGDKRVYGLAKVAIEKGLDEMQQVLLQLLGGEAHPDLGFVLIRSSE